VHSVKVIAIKKDILQLREEVSIVKEKEEYFHQKENRCGLKQKGGLSMAKGNQYARSGQKMHSKTEMKYKIPLKDRQAYMGTNREKWVTKKTYDKYREWIRKGRPKR